MNSFFASQLICLSYMRNKLAYKSISAKKKKIIKSQVLYQ